MGARAFTLLRSALQRYSDSTITEGLPPVPIYTPYCLLALFDVNGKSGTPTTRCRSRYVEGSIDAETKRKEVPR